MQAKDDMDMPVVEMVPANRSETTSGEFTANMFIAEEISPNVRYVATLLGLIVMQAGVREKTAMRGLEVEKKHEQGTFTSSKPYDRLADVVGTIGHDMIHSGELDEMRDFRNHVVHGVNSVTPSSGALTIRHVRPRGCADGCKFYSGSVEATYTVEELESWTSQFLLLDPVLRDKYVSNLICLICGSGTGCDCKKAPSDQCDR